MKANVTLLKYFVLVKSFSLHSVRLRVAGVFGGHMICKPCLRCMHSFARLFLLLACEWRFHQNPQGPQTISCLLMLGDRRSSRHFGGWMLQSIRRWLAYWSSAPQMPLCVSSMPQGYRHVPKPLTPVFSLFCVTQRLWGSSEPGGRQTAGITKNWDGGWALSHATLHDSMRLKRQKGRREHRCVPRDCAPWTREWRGG